MGGQTFVSENAPKLAGMTFSSHQIGEASAIAGTADFLVAVTLADGTVGHCRCGVGRFNETDRSFGESMASELNARIDVLGADDVLAGLKRGDLRLDPLV
jgi:hypothetical protein